jgi:hypothetical protein
VKVPAGHRSHAAAKLPRRNRNFDPMPGTVHFAFAPASLIVGALTVAFEKAGFREAGRAGMRRHVMRLHLGG